MKENHLFNILTAFNHYKNLNVVVLCNDKKKSQKVFYAPHVSFKKDININILKAKNKFDIIYKEMKNDDTNGIKKNIFQFYCDDETKKEFRKAEDIFIYVENLIYNLLNDKDSCLEQVTETFIRHCKAGMYDDISKIQVSSYKLITDKDIIEE